MGILEQAKTSLSQVPRGDEEPQFSGSGLRASNVWASLVAQVVKNPPAMLETWVRSLGWEDPLEKGKGMATYSSILGVENPVDRGAWWAIGSQESDRT